MSIKHTVAPIPLSWIGPLKINGPIMSDQVMVPLVTFESPLWPSTNRGAKATRESGGISVIMKDERMARSIVLESDDAYQSMQALETIEHLFPKLKEIVKSQSRFTRLIEMNSQLVGNQLFIRFEYETGDASGHNMVTQASQVLCDELLKTIPTLHYVSISGNYCTDKKVSAVNGILGRGKYMVADVIIPKSICESVLKTTAPAIVDLNLKKNWIGTSIAGGLRSANAHFANMLLAIYLATGQDAANIIEGSQGFVHTEARGEDLYFSVTLPNLIVGTVGNGKNIPFVKEHLEALGCLKQTTPGDSSRRLAAIVAGTVLCGELSLLAAQTNSGELMKSHIAFERNKQTLEHSSSAS